MDLTQKKCVACEGGVKPLTPSQIEAFLHHTPNWLVKNGRLTRKLTFKDFSQALAFVNKVGLIAEQEGHHPDMHLTGWNNVTIELWTHAINGLHENDFIVAAKINALQDI